MGGMMLPYVLDRLKEPSTYAGLSALLVAFGVHIEPGMLQNVVVGGIAIGGAIAAAFPDPNKK